MQKRYHKKYLRHQRRRQRKQLKHRRNSRPYINLYNVKERTATSYQRKTDNYYISRYQNEIYEYLREANFKGPHQNPIRIEKEFSLIASPEKALNQLSIIHHSVHYYMGSTLHINFTNCEVTDLHTLFVLRVIVQEYRAAQSQLQDKVRTKEVITGVKITLSKVSEVNKRLLAAGIINTLTTKIEEMMPISEMGVYIGTRSQSNFAENKKGATATKIVKYIADNCLSNYGYHLSHKEKSDLIALISEVLNNAEDHSLKNKWYATGALFEDNRLQTDPNKEVVGELTLTIMNFGQSFYEGFEETREQNEHMYNSINQLCENVQNTSKGKDFTKENLFTLYALQDGISRLKYETESRGTGTMKFINSFTQISDYEDSTKKYHPYLIILTGNTLLRCDNQYRPYEIDGDNYLSLNKENDLKLPPEKENLISLPKKFPGTLLAVKVYLNKQHLMKKR